MGTRVSFSVVQKETQSVEITEILSSKKYSVKLNNWEFLQKALFPPIFCQKSLS